MRRSVAGELRARQMESLPRGLGALREEGVDAEGSRVGCRLRREGLIGRG